MATNSVKTSTLIATLVLVAAVEWTAPVWIRLTEWPKYSVLGTIRLIEIAGMIAIVIYFNKGLQSIGWSPRMWAKGMKIGIIWSLAFGVLAAIGIAVLFISGRNPFTMLRTPLPADPVAIISFYIVGGLIGPVAEELCFRGIVFSFCRRWGVIIAVIASTAVFASLHSVHGFPVIQVTGGLLFAVAYAITRNLMTPIIIHVAANSALFTLSLPWLPF